MILTKVISTIELKLLRKMNILDREFYTSVIYNGISDRFQVVGLIDEDCIIKMAGVRYPDTFVTTFTEVSTGQLIIYSGPSDMGDTVIVPISDMTKLYTNHAKNCPILIQYLRDERQVYMTLTHMYKDRIDEQMRHILHILKGRHMHPINIVFSPRQDSCYKTALTELEVFSGDPQKIRYAPRLFNNNSGSSAYVSSRYWGIHQEYRHPEQPTLFWGQVI